MIRLKKDPNNTKLLVLVLIVTIFSLVLIGRLKAQDCNNFEIKPNLISKNINQIQSGSCASPNGSMNSVSSTPPNFNWLNSNGYCYTITATKNFTACYTFTSTGSSININSGYSSTGCAFISFSNLNLYSCFPSCTLIGSGTSFTGLIPGQCYTWCFSGNCTGPGPGFTSLCPYWQDVTPLPILLMSLECIDNHGFIELKWVTGSESNNKEFKVLRSVDSRDWEYIATVKGKNTPFTYVFRDYFPLDGVVYYKLQQIDLNGNKEEFNSIYCNHIGNSIIKEYYNILGEKLIEPNGVYIIKLINNDNIKYEIRIKK